MSGAFGDECPCRSCQALNFDPTAEARREALVDFNTRCLELARQNGFTCLVREDPHIGKLWLVPHELRAMVGCMAAVVR